MRAVAVTVCVVALALFPVPAHGDGQGTRAGAVTAAGQLPEAVVEYLRDRPRATAQRSQAFATLGFEPFQGIENYYTDVCDDAGGSRLDARRSVVGHERDLDVLLFAAQSCVTWTTADMGDGVALWFIYPPGGRPDGPDYIVAEYVDVDGEFSIEIVRTPCNDPALCTWTRTWYDFAHRRDAYDVFGFAPVSALDGHDRFFHELVFVDDADRADRLPELDEFLLPFPGSCQEVVFGRAVVRSEPARMETALAHTRGLGLDVVATAPALGAFEVALPAGVSRAGLARLPGVRAVEPVRVYERLVVPNDPHYPSQWALPEIGAPAAWDVRAGSGLTVAVVDDGVDATRPDLAGRVLAGRDTALGKPLSAGANSDRGGHGTAVSGIIGAAGDNGTDIAGVDWDAQIVPYRVFDAAGCATDVALANAITDAADRGVAVVNLSLGGPDDSALLGDAVRYAYDRGVVLVAAVGNQQETGNALNYPAAYPETVAVGATTRNRTLAFYSNTGSHLDVVAPGGDASGTVSGDILTLWERDSVAPLAGTSFAVPYVTGAVSLYLAGDPQATPAEVVAALAASAVDLGPVGRDDSYGHGLLDLAALLGTAQPAPDPTPIATLFDGDPATTQRVGSDDPVTTAVEVSQARFGDGEATRVVLSRSDDFPDSLAGAALTGGGPLLYTHTAQLPDVTVQELRRVLAADGRVYLLGGTAAISGDVEAQLRAEGYDVVRLWGPSRVETSVAVAREVIRFNPQASAPTVLVARAHAPADNPTAAWADSVTGGAWAAFAAVPIVVTPTEAVHPAVAEFLSDVASQRTVLLGGTAALSTTVEQQVPNPERVAGPERAATAAEIARRLWEVGDQRLIVSNGFRADGWAFGLLAAGAAADGQAPLLLADVESVPPATMEAASTPCDTPPAIDLLLVGNEFILATQVLEQLDRADGGPCP